MEKHLQICPSFFSETLMEAQTCSHCGSDMATHSAQDYAVKLIGALKHPLLVVRMRAIIALGWRSQEADAPHLLPITLRCSTNVVEGTAVVESLSRLCVEGRHALMEIAKQHRAHAVRESVFHYFYIYSSDEGEFLA